MDDELDEDVIFENSALYKHIQSAGVEGIPTEPLQKMPVTKPKPKPPAKEVDYASLFIDILGKCYQNVVFYLSKTKWGTENLEAWYHMTTLKHVQSSTALEEEDSSFLENYRNCHTRQTTLTEPSVYDCFRKWNGPINYLSTGFLVYVLIWCTGIFPLNLRPMADFLAVAFGVCMLSTCFDVCFYWWKRRIYMETTTSIEKCVDISEKVLHLSRQSLRLVQEKELVARGFTLVSQRISGMENTGCPSSTKMCSDLRKSTFLVARSGMMAFREATLKLLELHPLIPEVDSVSNYLASVPLSDYGPCLQTLEQEVEDVSRLSSLTDHFSVSALRGMNQLFALYLSEFIRRLTLCFITDAQLQGSPAPFDKLKILMEELYLKLEKDHLQLLRSYDYHKSSPLNREVSKTKIQRAKSRTGEFYTAVHSLDLHLQAALVRVQELSEKLELELGNKPLPLDSTDQSEESQEAWFKTMGQIKAELEACKGCWEEGIGRIRKTSNDRQVPKLDSTVTSGPVDREREIKIVEVGEYIIEDQVFEGFTDNNVSDDFTWNWEPIISPEEKEKKKKEKEEAKRLLSELRSVISIRAEDRERREKIAIEKQKTTISDSTTDSLLTTPHSIDDSKERQLTVTRSDILSSTKTELSPFDHKSSSLNNISPILSDEDSSPVKNGIIESSVNSSGNICSGSNKGERIHSDVVQGEVNHSGDSLVSVSDLDEKEISKQHKKIAISKPDNETSNISDSEYSTTSSIHDNHRQNSLDIDSSSFVEESKTNPSKSLETSSGFFEQHQKLVPSTTRGAENLGETFSIDDSEKKTGFQMTEPVTNTKQSKTQGINKENIYPVVSGKESMLEDVSESLESSPGIDVEISGVGALPSDSESLSTTDQKTLKVSSDTFYSPLSSFSNDISGVAPLVDSQLSSPIPKPRSGKPSSHKERVKTCSPPTTGNLSSFLGSEKDQESLVDEPHENCGKLKTLDGVDLPEINTDTHSQTSSCVKSISKPTPVQWLTGGQPPSQNLDSSSLVSGSLPTEENLQSKEPGTLDPMDTSSSNTTFKKPQGHDLSGTSPDNLKTREIVSPSVLSLSETPLPIPSSSNGSVRGENQSDSNCGNSEYDDHYYNKSKTKTKPVTGNHQDDEDDFKESSQEKSATEIRPSMYHNMPKSLESDRGSNDTDESTQDKSENVTKTKSSESLDSHHGNHKDDFFESSHEKSATKTKPSILDSHQYESSHDRTETKTKPATYHNVPKSSETFEHDPETSDLDNTDSSDQSFDITSPDTSTSSSGETGQTDLDIRISRLPGANLAFSANIAAMAAARSLTLNLNIDTFGDSSSDEGGGGGEGMCGREYEEEKSDDSIRV